jgi:hypothetical protein
MFPVKIIDRRISKNRQIVGLFNKKFGNSDYSCEIIEIQWICI